MKGGAFRCAAVNFQRTAFVITGASSALLMLLERINGVEIGIRLIILITPPPPPTSTMHLGQYLGLGIGSSP